MSKKLYIKTMGCQMNEYDSDKMADVLRESHGYELTNDADEADLLLVNTCSIREKAQEKVFSELGRWRPLKEKRPGVMIGVGGCVASQEGEGIIKRAPFVDVVFGPQTLHRLPELIEDAQARNSSVVDISFPEIEKFDRLPEPRAEGPTAFVSVMEGCSKYCSFCVVPYTRGEEISRPFDGVIAEFYELMASGQAMMPGADTQRVTQRMIDYDWFGSYRDITSVAESLDRVAQRIRFANDFDNAIDDLQRHHDVIRDGFFEFYPQLQQHVAEQAIE